MLIIGLTLTACESPAAPTLPDSASLTPDFLYTGSTENLTESWFQGFEVDTDDWVAANRVASGTGGITSATGSFHGQMTGSGYSYFGGTSDTWPGDYVAEIKVYLDPAWSPGDGFDYTVASYGTDGSHQRDFMFHVGVIPDGSLLVNGDNNSYGGVNAFILQNGGDGTPYEVQTAGWFTLQHIFYDEGGVLAVDLNLIDSSGSVLWTTTRSDASDTIGIEVGGNGYAWFPVQTFSDLAIDDHLLGTVVLGPTTMDDCKKGGWQDFDFRNQGQCVASVQANERAGK